MRVVHLKRYGVVEASQLRRLGFDALHLVDPEWCADASAAHGASNVISAFLVSPHDAVALSGSEAMKTLNITVDALLEACAGAPVEAVSVLQQVTHAQPLAGVRSSVSSTETHVYRSMAAGSQRQTSRSSRHLGPEQKGLCSAARRS